jgi:hypothetical protein
VLDDAFRCLITVAHSMLVPDHKSSNEMILAYYEKALHSLQSAVKDSIARYSAEVLCATAILALFEVSNARWRHSELCLLLTNQFLVAKFAKCTTMESAYCRSIPPYAT